MPPQAKAKATKKDEIQEEEEEQTTTRRSTRSASSTAKPAAKDSKAAASKSPAKGKAKAEPKAKASPAKGKAKAPAKGKAKAPAKGKGKGKKEESEDEEEEEESWKEDDVVGCLLSIESIEGDDSRKKVEIGYYLNGVKVNPGFQFTVSNESAVFFPALSIEEQESIRLNLGKDIYKFPPSLISISNCL